MNFDRLVCGIAAAVCIGLASSAAHAVPITYSVFDTATGSLGGVAFTNELVTVRFVSDTTTVTGSAGFFMNSTGVGSVTIGSGMAVLFTDPGLQFFVNQSFNPPAAGISVTDESILDTFSTVFATYDGRTAIGPITGAVFFNAGQAVSTASGNFVINSAGANSTFTASITPAAVPEPETLALFGLGVFAFAMSRRRRSHQA